MIADPVFPQLDRLADYRDEGRLFGSRANRTSRVRQLPVDQYMGLPVDDEEPA